MQQQQSPEDPLVHLQPKIKMILQSLLQCLKPNLRSKSQQTELQELLVDYQSIEELLDIVQNVTKMMGKVLGHCLDDQQKNMIEIEQYKKLQNSLQMLQAKQRSYIKGENQMKLYCEELEVKVKQLQQSKNQLVVSTKKVIMDLKRDNQGLIEKIRMITSNNNKDRQKQRQINIQRQRINNQKQKTQQNNHPSNPLSSIKARKQTETISHHTHHREKAKEGRLPKAIKGSQNMRAESSLRSKLEQYQEVIQSIEAARGRKNSNNGVSQTY